MLFEFLNSLELPAARTTLSTACAAEAWVVAMLRRRPFASDDDVFEAMRAAAAGLSEEDWLEAFAAHPMIGDVASLREKYASTSALAAAEQAGATAASEAVLEELAELNQAYFERHGFIFIVCASGKTADEMLTLLRARLPRSRREELQTAAQQQLKITELRLQQAAP